MIPDYLRSTYQLIASAYPNGIDQRSYIPLLKFIAEYMSQRNLAEVIAMYTGKDADYVFNDVLFAGSVDVSGNELERIRANLEANDLQDWINESY